MEASRKDKLAPAGTSSALALSSKPIQSIDGLVAALAEWRQKAIVLSPVVLVDHIAPMHQVSLRAVVIDPTVDEKGNGPECYFDGRFCKPGEVAPGKNALMKIMAAAGINKAERRDLDDRKDPYYAHVEVTLVRRDFDGSWLQIIASKEMDLRPGSPETMKPEYIDNKKTGRMVAMEDTAIADKRRHIRSHAETKATERALREMMSIAQKYSADALRRLPIVVTKLVQALDPNDPEQKAALIDDALASGAKLYGPRAAGGVIRTLKAVNDEQAIDVSYMAEAPQEPAAPPAPTEPELPPEEPATPPCGLPITQVMLEAVDPTRARHVQAIAKWVEHAAKRMPPDPLEALCLKLGTGFDPLSAPVTELEGMIGALKAEIARVTG